MAFRSTCPRMPGSACLPGPTAWIHLPTWIHADAVCSCRCSSNRHRTSGGERGRGRGGGGGRGAWKACPQCCCLLAEQPLQSGSVICRCVGGVSGWAGSVALLLVLQPLLLLSGRSSSSPLQMRGRPEEGGMGSR